MGVGVVAKDTDPEDLGREPLNCASKQGRNRTTFLLALFKALDSHHIRYCVLHSWDELPEKLPSDLDIAVHPEDRWKLTSVFRALREQGYTPVQVFNYLVGAYYFVFFWSEGQVIMSAELDLIFEHRRGGLIVSSGESLVANRRREATFWIPPPEAEFTYLLAKKTGKGKASARQVQRMKVLVDQMGNTSGEKLAAKLFLGQLSVQAVKACRDGHLDMFVSRAKNQTWKTSLVRTPAKLAAYLLSDGLRRIRRFIQPTGFFIAVIGPDGSGKSTLISQLIQVVGPAFRRTRVFHWRPMLLWRRTTTSDVTRPHGRPLHTGWWSVARLFAHLLDYWLGYCLLIRPLLARSGFVVFDRYFADLLIDPRRYQYGGPAWLPRLLQFLVPEPHLLLVLDAPTEIILSRKQEVAPQEVERQRKMYTGHRNGASCIQILDASSSLEQVTAESARAIIDRLALRFEGRHRSWLFDTQF
jgi:thymidylate kinase